MNSICVIASMNIDLVSKVEHIPVGGETVIAESMEKYFGGKGANQAVTVSRLGGSVSILGTIGLDAGGIEYKNHLIQEGIDVSLLQEEKDSPTGTAFITVDHNSQNSIVVVSGANDCLTEYQIENERVNLEQCKVIVSQFEVPLAATKRAFEIVKKAGGITILNPAPMKKMDDALLGTVDILIPNETEMQELLGIETNQKTDLEQFRKGAEKLLETGIRYLIITLGAEGSMLVGKEGMELIPAKKVVAVDTTAAGDSYVGAVAYSLHKHIEKGEVMEFKVMKQCCEYASRVSALTVQKEGAQASIPYADELAD